MLEPDTIYSNMLDVILQDAGGKPRRIGNKVLIDPCPFCGHFGHFYIYPKTQSYYSFANCCKGGTLVDWYIEYHHMSLSEAMKRVCGDADLTAIQEQQNIKQLAKILTRKVEDFFNVIIQKYKIFKSLSDEFTSAGITCPDPVYRFIRQAFNYYDRLSDEFINGKFETKVKLMDNYRSDYFFKVGK
jgi:hypothetical protein